MELGTKEQRRKHWAPSQSVLCADRQEGQRHTVTLNRIMGDTAKHRELGTLAVCFLSLVTTKCFYRCDDSRGKQPTRVVTKGRDK